MTSHVASLQFAIVISQFAVKEEGAGLLVGDWVRIVFVLSIIANYF
jgi:hypothetical protein